MEITIKTLIELFLTTKSTEGRSDRTISWYREKLYPFERHLSVGREATLPDLTLDNARDFVASLQQQDQRFVDHPYREPVDGGLSDYTIHGYVRAIRAFSAWLVQEDFLSTDPLAKLKRPKLSEPMIEVLSDQEIADVIEAINPNTFNGARMYAIVLVLLDTGIRASECCALTIQNTHLEGDYAKVIGKGNKERIVPFGATTKKALLRYTATWRPEPELPTIDNLFLTPYGAPMSYSALRQSLKRLGKRAGVPRIRAHLFRHTFAVRYLMNGGDVMTLRLLLGHSTLDVTQMYMHLAEVHIKVQYSKFSPVDRLGISRRRRVR
jgi:site-specific recombinase XerD